MSAPYDRPPITEAVVDFRTAQPLTMADVERVAERFASHYPVDETETTHSFKFENDKASARTTRSGRRLSSSDGLDILLLRVTGMTVSRLAPYPGWDAFASRVRRDFSAWRKAAGAVQLGRIGVRYLNRIDIPKDAEGNSNLNHFLTIHPLAPMLSSNVLSSYGVQMVVELTGTPYTVAVNSGDTPTDLPNSSGVLLDIDVSRSRDIPASSQEILDVVDEMREIKNKIFEESLTDEARSLFKK